MKSILFKSFLLLSLFNISLIGNSQEIYSLTKENLEARENFQNNKYGMFIHFGLYSELGRAEWVMNNDNIRFENYKKLAELFSPIEIVAKGGAYLLNIGPEPDGDFDPVAYDRLEAIGKWMDINGTAIYKTRPVAPYYKEQFYYTQSKDGKTLNVFHTPKAVDQDYVAAEYITFTIPDGFKPKTLKILGLKSKNLKWKQKGNKIELTLPKTRKALEYATVIQLTK